MSQNTIIELKDIRKSYDSDVVLDGIDFITRIRSDHKG